MHEPGQVYDFNNPVKDHTWSAHLDETSQKTYYHNSETKETTWEKPKDYIDEQGNKKNQQEKTKKLASKTKEKARPTKVPTQLNLASGGRSSRLAHMKKRLTSEELEGHNRYGSVELISVNKQQPSSRLPQHKKTHSGRFDHVVNESKVKHKRQRKQQESGPIFTMGGVPKQHTLVDLPIDLPTKEDDPPSETSNQEMKDVDNRSIDTSTKTKTKTAGNNNNTGIDITKKNSQKDRDKRRSKTTADRNVKNLLTQVEEQERIKLHVLESLHAVGFSARSFRHRARDIVNVTNIFLLVISMTLILLVSYTYSRNTIDTTCKCAFRLCVSASQYLSISV